MNRPENNNSFNFYRRNNRPYGNSVILNELHNMFPALIYESYTFRSLEDIFSYVHRQIDEHYNVFNRNRQLFHERSQRSSRRFQRGGRVNNTTWRVNTADYRTPPAYQRGGRVNTTTYRTPPVNQRGGRVNNTTWRVNTADYRTPPAYQRGERINTTTYRTPPANQRAPVSAERNEQNSMASIFPSTSISASDLSYLISAYMFPSTVVPPNFNDAVPVIPSETQVRNASTTFTATHPVENGCSICQDDIGLGDELRRLTRCRHLFHTNCIDTWFARNVHCPVCRFDIRDDAVSPAV